MYRGQDPVPDSWYVNRTGKVVKVRCLLYLEGCLDAVIIETLEGRRNSINLEYWYELHMSRYCCATRNQFR